MGENALIAGWLSLLTTTMRSDMAQPTTRREYKSITVARYPHAPGCGKRILEPTRTPRRAARPTSRHAIMLSDELIQSGLDAFRRSADPFGITTSLLEVQQAWLQDPIAFSKELGRLGSELWYLQLQSMQRLAGVHSDDAFPAAAYDERFQEPIWTENPYLDVIKEYYLLYTRWLEDTVFSTPDVPEKTRRRAALLAAPGAQRPGPDQLLLDEPGSGAASPWRPGATACLTAWQQLGRGQPKGQRQHGRRGGFRGRQEPGHHARTGGVPQRAAGADPVRARPPSRSTPSRILIVAPWINKYYILDLNAKKSLVSWLVKQGFTLFITSWKNPTAEMRDTTMDDYMVKGLLPAVDAAARHLPGARRSTRLAIASEAPCWPAC